MSMFPKPTPNRPYCRKHGIEYSGYICPECAQEMRKEADLKKSARLQNANNDENEPDEYRPPVLCPKCLEKSLFYNQNEDAFECLNVKCRVQGKTVKEIDDKIKSSLYDRTEQERLIFNKKERERQQNIQQTEPNTDKDKSDVPATLSNKPTIAADNAGAKGGGKGSGGDKSKQPIPKWMIPLLLIFALSFVGIGISIYVGTIIPFWILFGFGCIFSLEKWSSYYTRKHKGIGKLYRLLLNLCVLLLLGLLIWSGVKLFSHQLVQNSLAGSLLFLGEFVFFIWMWRVVSRNSWRWPSMKLTVFSLLVLTIVFAFAGVQPISTYKNDIIVRWNTYQAQQKINTEERLAQEKKEEQQRLEEQQNMLKTSTTSRYPTISVNPKITSPKVTLTTVENSTLKNPSWNQLLIFLKADKTDEMPYIYPTFVCDNFASTLQSNAKKAGWRCAKVILDMTGYTDPYNLGIASDAGHACNAFETTDRGLVFIDCTGPIPGTQFPPNNDMQVSIVVGQRYRPVFLFPNGGWTVEDSMGTVTGIKIRW